MSLTTATIPLTGIPVKAIADGKERFARTKRLATQKREDHCTEMIGLFEGPIGVDEFIEEFTQPPDAKDIPPSLPNLFAGVPLESTGLHEAAMYPPLVRVISFSISLLGLTVHREDQRIETAYARVQVATVCQYLRSPRCTPAARH